MANIKYLRISFFFFPFFFFVFADFLRTAGDKHGYHLSNMKIIILKLSFRSENVDIEMQVRDRHVKKHWALERLEGDFTG